MKQILLLVLVSISLKSWAQDSSDYYYELPEPADSYTAGSVASRLLDGLGYRYYWATAGLTEDDYSFQPNDEARSTGETIDHVWGLSVIIRNAAQQKVTDFSKIEGPSTFEEKRISTLENIRIASLILKQSKDQDLAKYDLNFSTGEGIKSYPFWNGINGPIADAIWHAGQLASFRRSSGNPINPNASMMTGKIKTN
ncbi:hypothetical protein [Reichenbachiella ulvae]|uniref:DinB superfamily protein n=1 Tax=Reichenbachiella ulvae TaxID=2980104 RepID=A0ABT3CRP2_9BACT|nr:hypothetical protein [Reichenbachiella ulvae]MCV9386228.1 hypothetical protein [Reichenbachiella ulvae]